MFSGRGDHTRPIAPIAATVRRIVQAGRLRVRHFGDHLACRHVVELVTDYVEDGLSDDERHRFERHLRACPDCERYVEQVRRTVEVLGELRPQAPSGATRNALVREFRDFHRDRSS